MAFLISIMMLTGATTAKADLPPAPEQCASQDNCFAILGYNELYINRKGVEKGPIAIPGTGIGTISYSNGYLIGTWDNENLVWLYHLQSGTNCFRSIGTSCREAVVEGQNAFVACPAINTLIEMPLDCNSQIPWPSQGNGPETMTQSSSELLIGMNGENQVGSFQPGTYIVSHYGTNITGLEHIRYHAGTSKVYYNGNNGTPGIFFKDVPLLNTPDSQLFLQLPPAHELTFMSISDTHLLVSNTASAAYLIEIANPANYQTIFMAESRANALSHDTAYIIDAGTDIRAYDMQGNEKTSFSPISLGGSSIAYIHPTVAPVCNNGLIEPSEVCDGSDFDGATCVDHGFDGGELGCSLSCDAISTINCYTCGDGVLNLGEECDSNDLGPETCNDYGYTNGILACNANCTYDTSACYTCGDGFIDGAEQCESNDLNSGTCVSEGFVSGSIACGTDCMYDISGCSSCGDDIINHEDLCDGSSVLEACQTLGQNFTGGTLMCNSTCDGYDTSSCTECGNSVIEAGEECDLTELDGETCASLGYTGGTLACYANCTYNVQACDDPPAQTCGNNVVDPGEECDDGNRTIGDGCDDNCELEPAQANCGNNIMEADEQCDGTDLGTITCQSLGFTTGAVYCRSNCTVDAAGCGFGQWEPISFNVEPSSTPESGSFDQGQIDAYNQIIGTRTETCESTVDGEDLLMTTPADGFCPIELVYGGTEPSQKAKMGKVFVMIYKPENSLNDANPVIRIKPDGTFNIESGAHMRAHLWANPQVTLGNNEVTETSEESFSLRVEMLSIDPRDNETVGRFMLIQMASGQSEYCSVAEPDRCAVIVGGSEEVLDLDDLEKSFGEISRTPKSSGCAVTGSSSGNQTIPVFLVMTLLLLAVRIRRRK
jgi:cysteine-rich repeat protein